MSNFHSHPTFTAQYEYMTYFQQNIKINLLKLSIRVQQYNATDFQGWLKMTLKIKMACFFIFRSGF